MFAKTATTTFFNNNNSSSPKSFRKQFHLRTISANRDGSARKYQKVRYKGNAFGGYNLADTDHPRKTNLIQRKQEVLKIAAENYLMVRRL